MTGVSTLAPPDPAPAERTWSWISSIDVRQGDHPAVPTPIPGMLEGRVTLLAGAGGSGKTTLTEQLVRHLCSGKQLGQFPLPDTLMIGWCIYLEDIASMAQDRSLRAAPLGSLWEDSVTDDPGASSVRYLFGRDFRLPDLHRELVQAEEDGVLPGIVIIDHLRILIGSQPAGTSPNDWERRNVLRLVDLADEFGVHIVVLTHLNKEGKVSGTTELINCVDTAYTIDISTMDRSFATLKCHKMRQSPETDFALIKKNNGTWGFTDQATVSETLAIGIAHDIIKVLKLEERRTLSELCFHPKVSGERAGVRAALDRAKRRGWVRPYRGHWELVPGTGDQLLVPQPDLPEPEVPETPAVQRSQAEQPAPTRAALPAPRPAEDEAVWTPEPEAEDTPGFRGLEVLRESIGRSRMNPLPNIEHEHRGEAPWSLMREYMAGEPRWEAAELPLGGQLVTLDRNGSFPSACSSVKLAPNKLIHTGQQDYYDPGKAGLYLVPLPRWTDAKMPHPLGRIAKKHTAGEPVWITTPTMAMLDKLALQHRIERPAILDSWLGRSNGSLFEHFYKEAREARTQLYETGGDAYVAYKRSVSIALRLLWPKTTRSPFWRPDWRVSVVAEAAVRHWWAADNAVRAGAVLVSLGNVDEATFWTPDGAVPAPYEVGPRFGQVKVKPQVES